MPRLNSFYLAPDQWPINVGDMVSLAGSEAKHMGTVLRTEKDQLVRLFDGQGHEGLFSVVDAGRNRAILETKELTEHPSQIDNMTLAVGWGKSKRRNYLFEKTVELHGGGLLFWQAVRSQGNTPKQVKDSWMEKCIQAAKQCGSVRLPHLDVVSGGVDGLISILNDYDHCYIAWESEEVSTPLSPSMLS